jgi:hypothetical protein
LLDGIFIRNFDEDGPNFATLTLKTRNEITKGGMYEDIRVVIIDVSRERGISLASYGLLE